jgi:hypothetical protein
MFVVILVLDAVKGGRGGSWLRLLGVVGKSNRQTNKHGRYRTRMCILMVDVYILLGRVFYLKAEVIDLWKEVPSDVVHEFPMILVLNLGRNPSNCGRIMCQTDVAFDCINQGRDVQPSDRPEPCY